MLAVEGSDWPLGSGEPKDDMGEETLEEEWLGDRVLDMKPSDCTDERKSQTRALKR